MSCSSQQRQQQQQEEHEQEQAQEVAGENLDMHHAMMQRQW